MFSAFTRELTAQSWKLTFGAPDSRRRAGGIFGLTIAATKRSFDDGARVRWGLFQFLEFKQGAQPKTISNFRSQISDFRFRLFQI
jgi:hypothetical protein